MFAPGIEELKDSSTIPRLSGVELCCSWSPFMLVDLLTMLANYAWVFMKLNETLAELESYVEKVGNTYVNYEEDSHRVVSLLEKSLAEAEENCRGLGLSLSIATISRIRDSLDISKGFGQLKEQYSRLRERIDDELRARFLCIFLQIGSNIIEENIYLETKSAIILNQ